VQIFNHEKARAAKFNNDTDLTGHRSVLCVLLVLLTGLAWSQQNTEENGDRFVPEKSLSAQPLNVNWLYGAYVPQDARLSPLSLHQRQELFVRQTFVTPGIYVKTLFLASIDQAEGSPYEWGGGFRGFGHRLSSVYAQSLLQNVLSTAGNAALQYEPRYDRCRCQGLKPRTKHALMRAFLTYDHTEQQLRPQFALYGAAFGSGMLSSTWKPKGALWADGFKAASTQAGLGMLFNWLAEFAPELTRALKKGRPKDTSSAP
jgi:hypothetical protein